MRKTILQSVWNGLKLNIARCVKRPREQFATSSQFEQTCECLSAIYRSSEIFHFALSRPSVLPSNFSQTVLIGDIHSQPGACNS